MIRILPPVVFGLVALVGIGATAVVYRAEEAGDRIRFENMADESIDRIASRVRKHVALLISTHAFFSAQSGEVSRSAFQRFVGGLELEQEFEGIRGIGYAARISSGEEQTAEMRLQRGYGLDLAVWPDTDQTVRTPIVLLEPFDERNRAALGFDMFSEPRRRAAMQQAVADGTPHASAPVELVQEITETKQAGFLVYIPFWRGGAPRPDTPTAVDGFIYAPFRAGDLHDAALKQMAGDRFVLETNDVTGEKPVRLYQSAGFDHADTLTGMAVTRVMDIVGRDWAFTVRATPAFRSSTRHLYAILIGAISLLLALAFALATRFQIKAVESAHTLHAISEKTVQEKDLMLQEMKHRIKNSIARVLAIARQTAASSETLSDFSTSFSARLNAMANAQDMLTRSHWQRADLEELLKTELEQVFGGARDTDRLNGPKVLLDERTTQALGLTFHELATNALKYGGVASRDGDLDVHWEILGSGRQRRLRIDWVETSPEPIEAPKGRGFGSRLIDANIRGELGGSLEREFPSTGMAVRMVIPVPEGPAPRRKRRGAAQKTPA
ncbi:CHASE domain-containing protein [Stappia sp.]|uniref:CHASE domain-containing protein n=1 Tax=Stappia sp. TaxID=1870903 RepID=UPI0025E7A8C7|nr:CHASE domain-containing protein [Stappia sp.]